MYGNQTVLIARRPEYIMESDKGRGVMYGHAVDVSIYPAKGLGSPNTPNIWPHPGGTPSRAVSMHASRLGHRC
jgi:hypothetical protein